MAIRLAAMLLYVILPVTTKAAEGCAGAVLGPVAAWSEACGRRPVSLAFPLWPVAQEADSIKKWQAGFQPDSSPEKFRGFSPLQRKSPNAPA